MTQITYARFAGLLALLLVASSVQAQNARTPEKPTGPNIPMDIFLNSPSYEDDSGEEETDLLGQCAILPGHFVGMKHDLSLGANRNYYDPLTEAGPAYAEYYVAARQDQNTATNIFRTACRINKGTSS